jgi:hypothetical protein
MQQDRLIFQRAQIKCASWQQKPNKAFSNALSWIQQPAATYDRQKTRETRINICRSYVDIIFTVSIKYQNSTEKGQFPTIGNIITVDARTTLAPYYIWGSEIMDDNRPSK